MHNHQDIATLGVQDQPLLKYQSQHCRLAQRDLGRFVPKKKKALEFLLTMLKVFARTHLDIDERVAVGPCLRECYRVRLDRARSAFDAGISRRHRPGDFYHSWSDIKRAIPAPLRASVTGAINSTLGSGGGDTARETSADNFTEIETNVDTHVNSDTNRIRC